MRKAIYLITLILSVAMVTTAAAEEPKAKLIQLRDGSSLTGNVISLNRGVYTIKTKNLGTMQVKADDILSIANPGLAPKQPERYSEAPAGISTTPFLTKSNLGSQVQTLQTSILQDPQLMEDIQALMSDPDVVKILTDEAFMNKVMTLDMQAIEDDPRYRDLLYNPRMRRFIQKIQAREQR